MFAEIYLRPCVVWPEKKKLFIRAVIFYYKPVRMLCQCHSCNLVIGNMRQVDDGSARIRPEFQITLLPAACLCLQANWKETCHNEKQSDRLHLFRMRSAINLHKSETGTQVVRQHRPPCIPVMRPLLPPHIEFIPDAFII